MKKNDITLRCVTPISPIVFISAKFIQLLVFASLIFIFVKILKAKNKKQRLYWLMAFLALTTIVIALYLLGESTSSLEPITRDGVTAIPACAGASSFLELLTRF